MNSPDLRCLSVLDNGDVALNWLIPPDPNLQFDCYVIYQATFKTSTFTPIDSIYAYSTNTYTHIGAGSNTQSKYYFIRTKYAQSGLKFSASSDTLRSIWLSLITFGGAKELKLQYNDLISPKLTTSSSFTIMKEYPIGTWNTLRVYDQTSYGDTISVCTASLNYKILMNDQSGCVSVSNLSGGVYFDTKSPEEPFVDSISVLPNGNTVIAWKIPLDKDIVKYEIQLLTAKGNNTVLDLVNGRNSTIYTYSNTAANDTSIAIFVMAIDSCKRWSTVNYSLTTIHLKTQYSICNFKTELSWNAYLSMPRGLRHYQIFYSIDGDPFTLIGTTTLTAFTHTQVAPGRNITYFVRAVNFDKTTTSSSNRVNFQSYLVAIPDYIYVPNVSVVDKTTVQIKILIDTSKRSKGIDVLRSEDGVEYKFVAFIPYVGSPIITYNDETVKPNLRNYYYKVQLRDSCGNSRMTSNVSKTILLKVEDNKDKIFTKHLSWTDYEGFAAGVKNYNIYRLIDDVVEPMAIGTITASITQFTDNVEDISSLGAKVSYYIEALESPTGNPFGLTEKSASNRADIYMEGRLYIPTAFVPDGVNKKWLPITTYIDKSDYLLRIFDRWGQQIFQTNKDNEAWDGGDYPGDIYVYLISYKNARGEYKEAKGTVLLMR